MITSTAGRIMANYMGMDMEMKENKIAK